MIDDVAAQNRGALSLLEDFDDCIKRYDKENEWIYLLSGQYIKERDNVKVLCFSSVKKNWMRRILFDVFTTKRIVKRFKPDIFISLQSIMPCGVDAYKVLYIHQAIPFQNKKKFSFLKKNEREIAVYQYLIGYLIKASIKRVDKVIVQTEWMKQAVNDVYRLAEVIKIVPKVNVCVNENENESYVFDTVHFFYPTNNAIYKNIGLLEQACEILDTKNLTYSLDITLDKGSISENNKTLSKNIKFLGQLSRMEVFKMYKSSVLVFPSYIESFGYPLAEARECGSYILASDCAFSHELLNDYPNVKFFDPFSVTELADLMEGILIGKIKKTRLEHKTNNSGYINRENDNWGTLYHLISDYRKETSE